ncbi:MAG TPA: response regulator [Kiritimatiellia bacterium]|nr:response regulator [Kiritimatiellia bacterium]HMO98994.1 response regulator [Kiritimatiellia bacterium]HMP95881.1 response regulator [Kiritimatiellia bacterium]
MSTIYSDSIIGRSSPDQSDAVVDISTYIAQCCEKLVSVLGVYNVWIALTEHGAITTLASSFDQGFAPVKDKIASGWCPVCAERALAMPGVVVIEDIKEACATCPLSGLYSDRVGVACRIERGSVVYGMVRASAPAYMANDNHMHRQLLDAANQLAETLHQTTERKKIERELRESRRQLATLMDSLPGMAYRCRVDATWTMAFVSEGCRMLTGYAPEDLIENRRIAYADLIHPDDRALVVRGVNGAVAAREPFTLEYRIVNASGEERWVWERGRSVEVSENEQWLKGFITDVTERRVMEERIVRLQKHESLAVMAGGVAHDFNNILTAILGNAEMALGEAPPGNEIVACLRQIIASSQQAAELCHQLLYFCGRSMPEATAIDVNRVVESMQPLLDSLTAKQIRLVLKLEPDLPEFVADPADVRHVLLQLVVNAAESYRGSEGTVMVSSGVEFCEGQRSRKLMIPDAPPSGWQVTLTVTDQGCGMDAATRSRMFDPFFSTKFTGRGMGLASVQGIVEGLGGNLMITSSPGKGTSIKVFFPVAPEGTGTRHPQAGMPNESLARKVLLAEDDPALCELTATMLTRLGCSVLTAPNGYEAVRVYQQHGPDIDMVFMDVTMPDMDGVEAFRVLRQINPDIRVVMTTGYSMEYVAERVDTNTLVGILIKPFSLGEVKRVLGLGKKV